jgi:cytochrome c556
MNFKVVVAAGAIVLAGLVPVSFAQDDPITTRQNLMKENGNRAKLLFEMLQNKQPFDAAQAAAAFETISANTRAFTNHFPEGSDQGKTDALPVIWEDWADFEARAVKLADDTAATAAAIEAGGEDAFRSQAGPVLETCRDCHRVYQRPS